MMGVYRWWNLVNYHQGYRGVCSEPVGASWISRDESSADRQNKSEDYQDVGEWCITLLSHKDGYLLDFATSTPWPEPFKTPHASEGAL
jgi:hypothetical protein